MVKSKLSNKIFYDENNWIEEEDEGKKTTMFKINLKDVDVVIALGEISKKWKNYNVYYWPVYLIISEDDIKQMEYVKYQQMKKIIIWMMMVI